MSRPKSLQEQAVPSVLLGLRDIDPLAGDGVRAGSAPAPELLSKDVHADVAHVGGDAERRAEGDVVSADDLVVVQHVHEGDVDETTGHQGCARCGHGERPYECRRGDNGCGCVTHPLEIGQLDPSFSEARGSLGRLNLLGLTGLNLIRTRLYMRHACLVKRNTLPWSQTLVSQPAPIPAPVAALRPTGNDALQQRVAAAILEAAARLLAQAGGQASMNDVAAAAGVARATVYRYFPSRQALLDRLAELAVADAGGRLASARIEEVQPDEGVTRAVRALVDVGDYFIALARERIRPAPHEFQEKIAGPLRRLFERAQASGDIRADVPSSWLTESLVALVVGALSATPSLGREDAIATITSMFLDGARGRSASTLAL